MIGFVVRRNVVVLWPEDVVMVADGLADAYGHGCDYGYDGYDHGCSHGCWDHGRGTAIGADALSIGDGLR